MINYWDCLSLIITSFPPIEAFLSPLQGRRRALGRPVFVPNVCFWQVAENGVWRFFGLTVPFVRTSASPTD